MVMESQIGTMQQTVVVRKQESLLGAAGQSTSLKKRFRPTESIIQMLLVFCGVISIFTTLGIVFVLGDQSLLFLDSKAWVFTNTIVVPDNPRTASLSESITAGTTELTINWEGRETGERIPFLTNQYLQFGEEAVKVTHRRDETITIERGQLGTTATSHESGETLLSMESTQIRPLEFIPATLTLNDSNVTLTAGDLIRIGDDAEIMRVVEVGDGSVQVERGYGTLHSESDLVGQSAGNQQLLAKLQAKQAEIANHVELDPATVTLSDTLIQLPTDYSKEFAVGDVIRLGEDAEAMRVTGIQADGLLVERGYEGTEVELPSLHDGRYDAIQQPEKASIKGFFTGTTWQPQAGEFGIWALLTATLIITAIALLVSIPLGLGAAIYLSEYASPSTRNTLKPILEILAGIPTVVYGFFALTFMSPMLRQMFGDAVQGQNMLAAGLVVGILIIPMISSISEDALNAVPRALREASYGLGATKLETTIKVVLPAAISGLLAAIILATSRAIGETMVVAIAAGSGPNFTANVFAGAETMTGHIARISGGDLSYNSIDYNSIFAIGLVLFAITLLLNMLSNAVSRRLREAY